VVPLARTVLAVTGGRHTENEYHQVAEAYKAGRVGAGRQIGHALQRVRRKDMAVFGVADARGRAVDDGLRCGAIVHGCRG
jgi:hypothetical protein